jgi:hypothetical protein
MWRFGVSLLIVFSFVSSHVQATQTPEFNFSKEPTKFVCADQRPDGSGAQESAAPGLTGPSYVLTRLETKALSSADNPALTIMADPNSTITIVGKEQRDFSMQYCGRGAGPTETEARERLGAAGMTVNGGFVTLNSFRSLDNLPGGAFFVEAPANALTVTDAPFSSVEVRNMSGPVRVAASRARATILNTTGQVDVRASHIEFAGSRGNVVLRAEEDLRLAITSTKFEGTIQADAFQSVQIFVPAKFRTPFTVWVNHAEDFICRTDLCSKIKKTSQGRKGEGQVFIFTYPGDGSAPDRFFVRPYLISPKEATPSKVIIDNLSAVDVKMIETGPVPKQ